MAAAAKRREQIETAIQDLQSNNKAVDERTRERRARAFKKLSLREVLRHEGGIRVDETIVQGVGEWKREYQVVLRLQSEYQVVLRLQSEERVKDRDRIQGDSELATNWQIKTST